MVPAADGGLAADRGEFFEFRTDLSIPGRPGADATLHYSFQRFYRNQITTDSPMGHKWDHNYFEHLQLEIDGGVTHFNGLGRSDKYLKNNLGNFAAPPLFFTTLVRNPDGTYLLRYNNGTTKTFDTDGKLLKVVDRNNNSMSFFYNAQRQLVRVNDTLGRDILYQYAPSGANAGRLMEVDDFFGRKISFTYDANGDLVAVTGPAVTGTPNGNDFPQGKTTRYSYSSGSANDQLNHNLLTETRPNEVAAAGSPAVINQYGTDPASFSFNKVVLMTYGGTNASGVAAGGQYAFTYTQLNAGVVSDDPNLVISRTHETDRKGNVREYDFIRLGYPAVRREFTRGLRPGDPPVYVTTMRYNADGRTLLKTMPAGDQMAYLFDEGNADRFQQGNMLRMTHTPGPRGGDQSALVTTYTYETHFNQIKTFTDPRGNDPTFVPQNGGPNSPARYTTTYTFDYEVGVGTSGDLVHKQQPTVLLPNGTSQLILTDYTYNQFGQLTSETDPEGNVTQYSYYPMNDPSNTTGGYLKQRIVDATTSPRRTETTPPTQISTQYFYDLVGNVVRIIDGRGNDTLYSVNQLNQVVETQSEAPFRYITYTFYDANDNVIGKNIENRVAIESDGKPNFTADGNFTTQDGTPTFFTNRNTYDILDKLVKQDLDATGSIPSRVITQFQYDPNENRIRETYPVGNITTSQYDERDLLFTKTRGFGDPSASTTTYAYDLNRNLAQTVDGRGFPTNYQYDGFDRRIQATDAVGGQTISHYDPASDVIGTLRNGQPGGPSPTDNSGAGNVLLSQRTYRYDELSRNYQFDERPINGSSFVASGVTTLRPPSITPGPLNPGSISTQAIYDRNGRMVTKIDDDLATTSAQYDGVNRRVLVTDPQGNTTSYTYDANSNVTRTVETELSQKSGVPSESFGTTYQYDSHNRRTSVSDNCQNTRRSAYDSRNNLSDMTDAKVDNVLGCPGAQNSQGNSMRYAYDGLSRRLQVIQDLRVGGIGSGPVNGQITTTSAYDGNSRLTTLIDNNKNMTRYSYDGLDRRTTETLADDTATIYTYDASDNVVNLTDNNGTIQTHTYDANNRRIQTNVAQAAGVIGTTRSAYQYDGLSRPTRMTDNNDPSDAMSASTVALAYDSLGRLVEETQNGRAVDGAWFAQAQRTGLTYPNNRQLNYTYDSLERIQTIQDAGVPNNIAQYTYIGPQRVLQRLYQNGTRLTYLDNAGTTDIGYDGVKRTLMRRDLHSDNSLVVGFAHAYDREGNKNSESKLHIPPNSESYGYDSVYRIINFQRGQPPMRTEQWTLDGVGNWLVDTVDGLPETRTVNKVNEYTSINAANLTYDHNGNLTSAAGIGYQWDYKNRLRQACFLPSLATSCTAPGAVVFATYSYDAAHRRTRKVVINSGILNGTVNFYYDDWRTIEERDSSDTLVQQYVYGIYLDEPLVIDRAGGQRLFYHQNTLYSTFALTDMGGNVVEGYQYDAYGQQTVFKADFVTAIGPVSANGNPYMFTGQRLDSETGLLYYKNRYYDPRIGRFLQRDSLGYDGEMNLYEYASGNPINRFDSLGLLSGEATIEQKVSWGEEVGWRAAPDPLANYALGLPLEYPPHFHEWGTLNLSAKVACTGNTAHAELLKDEDSFGPVDVAGAISGLFKSAYGSARLKQTEYLECQDAGPGQEAGPGVKLKFVYAAATAKNEVIGDINNMINAAAAALDPGPSAGVSLVSTAGDITIRKLAAGEGKLAYEYKVCCKCCDDKTWDTYWDSPKILIDEHGAGISHKQDITGGKTACVKPKQPVKR
jgi:RHS repeat-associated protein